MQKKASTTNKINAIMKKSGNICLLDFEDSIAYDLNSFIRF